MYCRFHLYEILEKLKFLWTESRLVATRGQGQGLGKGLMTKRHEGTFFFLAVPHGMWDLSSPTRDRTCPPALEAWSLNN